MPTVGLQDLWNNGSWQDMVGPDGVNSRNCPIMQAPRLDHDNMAAEGAGAKRGLLESVLALSMPPEVIIDRVFADDLTVCIVSGLT